MKKLSAETIRSHKGVSFPGVTTAFICYDRHGNIFLAKRSQKARDEHGRWDAGGGGLRHGQTIEDTLQREIMEEYGVTPKSVEFLGYMDAFRELADGTPTHWVALYFAVEVDRTKLHINEPDMFDDSGWFTLETLPQPMHSQFDKFMKLYGKRLRQIVAPKP